MYLALMIAVGFSAGCGGELSPQGKKMLMGCYASYNRGDVEVAEVLCDKFLAHHSKTDRASEAILIRGLARYRQNETASAETDMLDVLTKTNNSALQASAMFILGEIALDKGHLDRAERLYTDCLANAPRDSITSKQSHYRLGILLQRRGMFTDADIQFEHLRLRFPESALAHRAERFVGAKAWTVQIGIFETTSGADAQIEALARSGIDARRQPILLKKVLAYAVWSGREKTFDAAQIILVKIKPIAPDAFVTTDRLMGW